MALKNPGGLSKALRAVPGSTSPSPQLRLSRDISSTLKSRRHEGIHRAALKELRGPPESTGDAGLRPRHEDRAELVALVSGHLVKLAPAPQGGLCLAKSVGDAMQEAGQPLPRVVINVET